MRILRGEQAQWIQHYRDVVDWIIPSIDDRMSRPDKTDFLGVAWLINEAGMMVDHSKRPLDDISNWRDIVHFPDLDAIDWEAMAQRDLANHAPERIANIMLCAPGGCFFIPLMNMMGFEDGLCAYLLDPEPILEFYDELASYYEKVIERCGKYYKPEMMILSDDYCSERAPFVSYETYAEFLRPCYKRVVDAIRKAGAQPEIHVCGNCDIFVDDWVAMGYRMWQPAQTVNDVRAISERNNGKLVINGAWDSQGAPGLPNASEEVVRQSVRDAYDLLANCGNAVFWDGDLIGDSEETRRKSEWIMDEAHKCATELFHADIA